MAGFTTVQCNHESSSQETYQVLCELKGGGPWEAGKGLMEEMLVFELGL